MVKQLSVNLTQETYTDNLEAGLLLASRTLFGCLWRSETTFVDVSCIERFPFNSGAVPEASADFEPADIFAKLSVVLRLLDGEAIWRLCPLATICFPLEEFFSLRLKPCGSVADFLIAEWAKEIFVREDLSAVVLSTDDLFFDENAEAPEPRADDVVAEAVVDGDACNLASSALADFVTGECVNALRRTCEGLLHTSSRH